MLLPCVAVKVWLDGLIVKDGAAVTVKVTGTVTPVAPVALSVIMPL